jgi:potassium-transporting ATPase KdpC subunit
MNLRRNVIVALLMTLWTTILLGVAYPLAVTGIAQALFPARANGQLVRRGGVVVGSRLIAQPFTSPRYFHPRPSAAGPAGYDASASGGSNLGPTNRRLIERVAAGVASARRDDPGGKVPIDMVTTSASGLDPDISPAAARFQAPRVARARGLPLDAVLRLVGEFTTPPDLGFLGEARVNVLMLNLALDDGFGAGPQRAGQSGSAAKR